MALGFTPVSNGNSGEFLPFVKYDSRAGRWFRSDRTQDPMGNWVSELVDITNIFCAVFDFENLEVGWALFPTGSAPIYIMAPLGQPYPAKPTAAGEWKQGFKLNIKLHKDCGGDVRQLASNAAVFRSGMDQLHDAYEMQKAANPGKLPVVKMVTTTPITTGTKQKSTNYQPKFEIIGWSPRPPDLVATAAAPSLAPTSAPSTGSTIVAPPTQKTPVMADDDMGFG